MSTLPDGFDLVTEAVRVAGIEVRVVRPRSAEDLIDEDDYARDERLPYWADLWPSGRVLAEWLSGQQLAGLRVVELGAGLALPSLVALGRGARVLATDWYPEALSFARANAAGAGVGDLDTLVADWGDPPDALFSAGPFDLVLGADVLYENRHGPQLAALMDRLVAPGGRVVIADPRRPAADSLLAEMRETGWTHRREDVVYTGPPDEQGRIIHLHHLARRADRAA